jgi:nicotinate-nucleotide adenylyltransferase
MRVALFGGSFNPPHAAHQLVALYVLETRAVDQLWLIPCFQHPFEKSLEPFADRMRMCELAAAALGPRARVSDVEGRLGGESRTLRTVQTLRAEHPGDEFSLVIGSDLQGETSGWYGAGELQKTVPFIVVGRGGHAAPGDSGTAVVMPAVSSTEVRERLRSGRPVDEMVPGAVLDYIRQRGLYGMRGSG